MKNLRENNWYFLETGSNDGYFNMACDLFLLESLASEYLKLPLLRVYAWDKPMYSVGFNQRVLIDSSRLKYPIVKRPSGGQAVLHGTLWNELTYSVVLKCATSFKQVYKDISLVLIDFLQKFGLDASMGYSGNDYKSNFDCFHSKTPADIVVSDVKVIGSAQYRKKRYILQHGSIRLDLIRNLSGSDLSFEDAVISLKNSFKVIFNVSFTNYFITSKNIDSTLIA